MVLLISTKNMLCVQLKCQNFFNLAKIKAPTRVDFRDQYYDFLFSNVCLFGFYNLLLVLSLGLNGFHWFCCCTLTLDITFEVITHFFVQDLNLHFHYVKVQQHNHLYFWLYTTLSCKSHFYFFMVIPFWLYTNYNSRWIRSRCVEFDIFQFFQSGGLKKLIHLCRNFKNYLIT